METAFAKFEQLAGHVKDYLDTKLTAVKLNAAARTSKLVSNLISAIIVGIFFILAIIFASVAGAEALSAWIGPAYSGYLIIAGFYFLVAIVIWKIRERLLRLPIMNAIITQLFKQEENEKD